MKTRWMVATGAAILLVVGGVWLIASPQIPSHQPTLHSSPLAQATPPAPSTAVKRAVVAPTIGAPTATPTTVTVNAPTTVTVTVQINPAPLVGGVNLLRLGPTGRQPTILGVMHDDGLNGDAIAGDGVYTLQVNFNEPSAGQIQLQVSAAFKGLLKRSLSSITTVTIWNGYTIPGPEISIGIPTVGAISSTPISSTSSVAFAFPDPSGGDPIPTIFVTVVSLPGDMDLATWFVNQSPSNQELLDASTYTLTTKPDGSAFLEHTGSTPDDYTGGPLVDAFSLSPDRQTLLLIQYNNQENPLPRLGVTGTDIDHMFEEFLSTISFSH